MASPSCREAIVEVFLVLVHCFIALGSDGTQELPPDAGAYSLQCRLHPVNENLWCASFSPDGKRIATGSLAGAIHLWNADNGQLLYRLGEDDGVIRSIAWAPTGTVILVESRSSLTVWDVSQRKLLHKWEAGLAAFTKDGTGIHAMARWSSKLSHTRFDLTTGREVGLESGVISPWAFLTKDRRRVDAGTWDSRFIVVLDRKVSGLQIMDAKSERVTGRLAAETEQFAKTNEFIPILVSPDGKVVVTREHNKISVWDTGSGNRRCSVSASSIVAMEVSPDWAVVAVRTAQDPSMVLFWGLEECRLLGSVGGTGDQVNGMAWAPDGKHIVIVSFCGVGSIWRTRRGVTQ